MTKTFLEDNKGFENKKKDNQSNVKNGMHLEDKTYSDGTIMRPSVSAYHIRIRGFGIERLHYSQPF